MKTLNHLLLLTALAFVVLLGACDKDDDPKPSEDTIAVNGTVKDDANTPLEGVSITSMLDATKTATTAADGSFSITVAKNDKLTFSKDGYESVEADAQATLNVTLVRLPQTRFAAYFDAAGNISQNPQLEPTTLKPGANLGTLSPYPAGFIPVSFKGAVDPSGTPWYEGWSFFSRIVKGQLTSAPITLGTVEVWNDAKMQAAGPDVFWTSDKTYVLDGFVFVGAGQTLHIEAGTVVQGKPGEDVNASVLIVARGGKILAEGTAEKPIIFTFEGDTGGSSASLRAQWGGLIILGKARLNSTPGESAIEGLPTNEPRGLYGGNDDADNSGVLRYVSIRHGGTNIGADNEINGLTLGGVGSGTTIEYVEVVGNKDDGIEWFGGTVNARYLISAFCADDGLDYDEGYRGHNQFVIVYQDPADGAADRGGEHDGGTDPETGTPYATPIFYNVTSVGNPGSRALTFRDNAGGEYHNSIFVNYGRGVDVEYLTGQEQDSYKQWLDGLLKLENNIFYNIAKGTTGKDLFTLTIN